MGLFTGDSAAAQGPQAHPALSTEEHSLLHAVDFRHRLESTILPALWAGRTVLADRYLFTALARDAARGLDFGWLLHAYTPLLWPDLVLYFSMSPEDSRRRLAATRAPHYYEAGQDVTGIEDPLASYSRFIKRVVREYENLSPSRHGAARSAELARGAHRAGGAVASRR